MVYQSIVFLAGLGILYFGADWLVRAASSIALRFGIRPMVIGLTVVALGTSMPEFLLNFFAVAAGEDALAVGNIIGSNISNIALILGVSGMLMPLVVDQVTLKKEYPIMVAVTLLFYYLASDGLISRIDGGILVLGLFGFMIFLVVDARRHASLKRRTENGPNGIAYSIADEGSSQAAASNIGAWKRTWLLLGGMIALTAGARLMVLSAVEIAHVLNVHPVVIGLTIVAIGTSLPELAASIMCALKGDSDMSVGNIMGSNMLNILFVVGLISLIQPMNVEPVSISQHFPVMIAFTFVLYPIARFRPSISTLEGGFLVASFIGYLVWLILPYL